MRGVRPPRYPTLWEACVNAIVFQQISLRAASAIMRRFVVALSAPLDTADGPLYAFPTVAAMQGAGDDVLRAAGLSRGKLATLRRVGGALASGALDEAMLEARASPAAAAVLRGIKGIGPWTAAVILLRGLGRGLAAQLVLGAIGTSGELVSGISAIAGELAQRSFDRRQEREADAFGLGLVHAEYGHVAGAADFFARLSASQQGERVSSQRIAGYFDTHPLHEDRLAALAAEAAEHRWSREGRTTPWAAPTKPE